jgi:hypothetical protein
MLLKKKLLETSSKITNLRPGLTVGMFLVSEEFIASLFRVEYG